MTERRFVQLITVNDQATLRITANGETIINEPLRIGEAALLLADLAKFVGNKLAKHQTALDLS